MSTIFTVKTTGSLREDDSDVVYKKLHDFPTQSCSMDINRVGVAAEPDPTGFSGEEKRSNNDYYKYNSFQFGNGHDGGAYLMAPTWGSRKRKGLGTGKIWRCVTGSMRSLKIGKKRSTGVSHYQRELEGEHHAPIEDRGSFATEVDSDTHSLFVQRSKKRKTSKKTFSSILRKRFCLWANSMKESLTQKSKSRHENGAFPTSTGSFPCYENYSSFDQHSFEDTFF